MNWAEPQLEELLDLADPGVWADEDQLDGISVLRSTNFNNDGTLDLTKVALRAISRDKRIKKTLASGDIVLERSGGSPRQPVGRVCYFAGDERPHTFGNFCQRLRPDRELVEPRFLFWYLHQFHTSGGTLAFQKQTTGIRNLEYKGYLKQRVPLPPLSEQRRIVEILDQADHLRRLRAEANAKADRILPALFLKMFGDPTTNPMGWRTSRLDSVSTFVAGNSLPDGEFFTGQSGGSLLAKVGDMNSPGNERRLATARGWTSETKGGTRAPSDSIIMPKRGAAISTNKKRILPRPAYLDPNLMAVVPGEQVLPEYLLQWFVALDLCSISSGSTVPQLNKKDLAPLMIPVPPLDVQQRFLGSYQDAERLVCLVQASEEGLARLGGGITARAFSGDLTAHWRRAHSGQLLRERDAQGKALQEAR